MLVQLIPDSQKINRPVRAAVSTTPRVDSTSPGVTTGRTALMAVAVPPVKRMIHSATMPTYWAVCMSSNRSPSPSMPNPMPTSRKMSSRGRPVR